MITGLSIHELLEKLHNSQRFIISMRRDQSWYFRTLKEDPAVIGVVWTPYMKLAHFFMDEESVEEFKMQFIAPRKVDILRI